MNAHEFSEQRMQNVNDFCTKRTSSILRHPLFVKLPEHKLYDKLHGNYMFKTHRSLGNQWIMTMVAPKPYCWNEASWKV